MITQIIASEELFPTSFGTDLMAFLSTLVMYAIFYLLLQSLGKAAALITATLSLLGISGGRIHLFKRFTVLLFCLLLGHFLMFTVFPFVKLF